MKQRKIPMRTCIVTKEQFDKKELIRIVKDKEGNVSVDPTGKANGRGYYLKKDLEVIEKARKNKIIDRVLEVEIPDTVYEELINIIK